MTENGAMGPFCRVNYSRKGEWLTTRNTLCLIGGGIGFMAKLNPAKNRPPNRHSWHRNTIPMPGGPFRAFPDMDRVTPRTKKSFHGQEPISQMQSISNKRTTMAHMRNEYPRHKQRTSPARPLARLGSSRITAKRFRRIIIESVSVFSNLLPLMHSQQEFTTGRAMPYRIPRHTPCSLIYSALQRARTPRLRSRRRRDQPWPSPRACATAARRECPAQSHGNRTSRLRP